MKRMLALALPLLALVGCEIHLSLLLIDTIVILIIPMAIPLTPCPDFITAIANIPFAFTPLITPVW